MFSPTIHDLRPLFPVIRSLEERWQKDAMEYQVAVTLQILESIGRGAVDKWRL